MSRFSVAFGRLRGVCGYLFGSGQRCLKLVGTTLRTGTCVDALWGFIYVVQILFPSNASALGSGQHCVELMGTNPNTGDRLQVAGWPPLSLEAAVCDGLGVRPLPPFPTCNGAQATAVVG